MKKVITFEVEKDSLCFPNLVNTPFAPYFLWPIKPRPISGLG